MLFRNEAVAEKSNSSSLTTSLSYENICKDSSSMKYLTGLSTEQFVALYSFLDSICPLDDIQLMYKVFRDMETVMFPSRAIMLRYLPRVFKSIKKIRCIVDCTGVFSGNITKIRKTREHIYSAYKHTHF